MPLLEASVLIARPVGEVWDYVTSAENPRWTRLLRLVLTQARACPRGRVVLSWRQLSEVSHSQSTKLKRIPDRK